MFHLSVAGPKFPEAAFYGVVQSLIARENPSRHTEISSQARSAHLVFFVIL